MSFEDLFHRHAQHDRDIETLVQLILSLTAKVDTIMTSQADLATALTALVAKIDGYKADLAADITRLQAALANQGGTSPEVDAAVAALTDRVSALGTVVQSVDALAPAAQNPAPAPAPTTT